MLVKKLSPALAIVVGFAVALTGSPAYAGDGGGAAKAETAARHSVATQAQKYSSRSAEAAANLAAAASTEQAQELFVSGKVATSAGSATEISTQSGAASVRVPDGPTLSMSFVGARPSGVTTTQTGVVAKGVAPSTNLVTRATQGGAEMAAVLSDRSAPNKLRFAAKLPKGGKLKVMPDGSVAVNVPVTRRESTQGERARVTKAATKIIGGTTDLEKLSQAQWDALARIPDEKTTLVTRTETVGTFQAPRALDASGVKVPSHYQVSGNVITQVIDVSTTTAFPVAASYSWWWWAWTSANCIANIAALVGAGYALLAARIAKLTRWLKAPERGRHIHRLVDAVGGVKGLINKMKSAAKGMKESRNARKYLSSQEWAALVGLVGAAGSLIGEWLGVGSCIALIRALR